MINEVIKNEEEKLNQFEIMFNKIFDSNDYFEYEDMDSKIFSILPQKLDFKIQYLFSYFQYKKYEKLYNLEKNKYDNLKDAIDTHNSNVSMKERQEFKDICVKIEGKDLDDNQVDSIVRKNKNQLVIASAGSGKTTTIVGKVKYLLKTNRYKPEEILLLSFTNASASEMKERIKNETGIDLDVFTFHKLGLEIIKSSINKNVSIFDKDLFQVIKRIIEKEIENSNYLNRLIYFMSTARFDNKDEFDFTSEKEYEEYLQTNKPITLNGEIVKSYGELEIANYLFENNIDYVYEKEYEINTMTDDYQQYKPDFYLPKYSIYIEYFGIDENNQVAPFFRGKNGRSASDLYNESIKWKREVHNKNNTIMIETYYYENKQKVLIEKLEDKLKRYNVNINLKTNEELWQAVNQNNNCLFNEICRVFETIINLIKSNNYSIDYLYTLPEDNNSNINLITLDLIKPIYETYKKILYDNNQIDFNDMINMAIVCIEQNKYVHRYKYVIVDEYQDISNSRYRLLRAMRNQNDYGLFCVGDDWQSIYRFSGSDIDLITNFEKYWGKTYISFIERTYRFTSMMSELSSNFIMRNPHQFRKKINAKLSDDFAIKFINGYTESNCVDFLEEKLYRFEKNSTVYLLGRYSFDIDIFKNNNKFSFRYNNAEKAIEVIYLRRQDLKIRFITVHKSKGLQADYVVIINNKNYGMGFPSKINDLPLIRLLLGGELDDYPDSEERRLFYVALTRAKKQTLLLTIDNNKSIFIDELEKDYKELMKNDTELKKNIYKCPECGGRLVTRKGPYGPFMGCSNYPDCKYIKKI